MENRCNALPFITFDRQSSRFVVQAEAAAHLSTFSSKVGVVAICGKYRTGKSYLLNKVFQRHVQR